MIFSLSSQSKMSIILAVGLFIYLLCLNLLSTYRKIQQTTDDIRQRADEMARLSSDDSTYLIYDKIQKHQVDHLKKLLTSYSGTLLRWIKMVEFKTSTQNK